MKRQSLASIDLTTTRHAPRLVIEVRSSIGYGPTKLAAFDDALAGANIANFNLLRLSSIIPPNAQVHVLPDPATRRPEGEWGDRLYVVVASAESSTPGEPVAAGIGWVQDPMTGRGLFVEHEVGGATEVLSDIQSTLTYMVDKRDHTFGPIQHRVISETTPASGAACALVVATFESQPWEGIIDLDRVLN